jgi:hypothetical protein
MATNMNKVLSGYQPCSFVKNRQYLGDHLCPHHQDSDGGDRVCVFNELTWLIAQEDFIDNFIYLFLVHLMTFSVFRLYNSDWWD